MFLKKGFTLVELMIVIAIIGILAAALFPSISGYLGRARDASRVINVRQIANVLQTYKGVYEVFPTNLTGATTNDYCVSDIFLWSDGASKDQNYQDLKINMRVIPYESVIQTKTSPCDQTGSYMYSRLIDGAGNQYGIVATTMESNGSISYFTGSDFTGSANIMKIMGASAQPIKGVNAKTLSGNLAPLYHIMIN